MIYYELSRDKAAARFASFTKNNKAEADPDSLNPAYKKIRVDLLKMESNVSGKDYAFDLEFGLKFYEYTLLQLTDFTEAVAANNDVWRYLCCNVVPEIVERRHGLVKEYFYDKTYRIYLQALWWYIHLSFQGTIDATRKALEPFSTDYIMQLVERSGRDGLYIEIYREIIRQMSFVPPSIRNHKVNDKILMRRVMIQNTAKNGAYNLIMEGKVEEYVSSLFKACGVEAKLYEQN